MLRRIFTVICAGAILALPVRAQDKAVVALPPTGPDFFSHILFSEQWTPWQMFQQAQDEPGDSVIVLLGSPNGRNVVRFLKQGMKPFLKDGGNLFIATDQQVALGAPLGVTVTGQHVKRAEAMGYHGSPFCPWLDYSVPIVDELPGQKPALREVRAHPVFNLLQQGLATNCPSHINFDNPHSPLSRLLRFPPRIDKFGKRPPLTYVAGSPKDAPPDGRVLVVAGYGTFMNSMILQKDNDNLSFAIQCLRWLRAKSDGTKRARALFVVDGEIITNFDRNLTPPPPPIPMPPATAVNRLLRGSEDEGLFHKAAGYLLEDSYGRVVPFLIVLATCALLLYGAKKFMEGRFWRDAATPRMVGVKASAVVAPSHGVQRQEAILRKGDPWEEARALIEQWLHRAFGVTPEDWAAAGGAAEFRAAGLFAGGWGVRRRANRLLEMLRRAGPGKATRGDLAFLVETLPALHRAVQAGRLTLLLDGKEVRQTSGA